MEVWKCVSWKWNDCTAVKDMSELPEYRMQRLLQLNVTTGKLRNDLKREKKLEKQTKNSSVGVEEVNICTFFL